MLKLPRSAERENVHTLALGVDNDQREPRNDQSDPICEHCGNRFEPNLTNRSRKNKQKYCSTRCRVAAWKLRRVCV